MKNSSLLFSFLLWVQYNINAQTTYYEHIAPIIKNHCTRCHYDNGTAPFSLTRFRDVISRANFIEHVTKTRYMPPWKANPEYRSFANENRLTDAEITLISKWVANGAQKGKKRKASEDSDAKDQNFSCEVPDLVLKMQKAFTIPGNNKQTYICYKIPYELPRDTFVKAVDFIPGNRKLVHHASYQVLAVPDGTDIYNSPDYFVYGDSDYVNDRHDYAVFNLIDEQGNMPEEVYHGGWLPGTSKQVFPEGAGFYLPKKGIFMIRNLHYAPSPLEETDQSAVHFYFTDKPVERTVRFRGFAPANPDPGKDWIIHADSTKKFHINVKIGSDLSLISVNPHMHLLGKYFISYIITPAQDTIPLVEIEDWDFNWQEFYRFKNPVKVPKGSLLRAEAIYDNTEKNVNNPFHPPRDVFFERGMDDKDEMMRLVFLFLPYREGDEQLSLE